MNIKVTWIRVVSNNGLEIIKTSTRMRYFEDLKTMNIFRIRAIKFLKYIYSSEITLIFNYSEYEK